MKRFQQFCFACLACCSPLCAETVPFMDFLHPYFEAFQEAHSSLSPLTAAQIALYVTRWEEQVALGLGLKDEVRKVDAQVVESLLMLLQEEQPKVFLCNADLLNPSSRVEWLGELILWDYLYQKTGVCFCLQTAEDQNSLEPANMLAPILGTCAQPASVWNGFVHSSGISPEELPKMIWEESQVDAFFGKGTFECMNRDMQEELHRPLCTHTVFFTITHEPQLKALSHLTQLSEEQVRPFSMLVITSKHVIFFPQGIFLEPPRLEAVEPSSQQMDRMNGAGDNEHPESEKTPPEGEIPSLS